jgi:hypothetical protein
MDSKGHAKVIETAFTKAEWKLLSGNKGFVKQMKRCKDLDDVERICGAGQDLISAWEQSNGHLD